MSLILEQSSKAFDGYQYVYSHESFMLNCQMKFGIYVPNLADEKSLPLLIFLSDANCTEQDFITKSGVQRLASKYGFIVANPDTSPRDGGCYIDAIENEWRENYQMFSYVNEEFYELISENFHVDIDRIGIFGHGLGGHGALVSFFKHSTQYKSVSAFAPIYDPAEYEGSRNLFRKYLGENEELWKEYDLCELVASHQSSMFNAPILIDQNSTDESKEKFVQACANASLPIQCREQIGYDQTSYFLSTFLEDHLKYHQNEFDNSN